MARRPRPWRTHGQHGGSRGPAARRVVGPPGLMVAMVLALTAGCAERDPDRRSVEQVSPSDSPPTLSTRTTSSTSRASGGSASVTTGSGGGTPSGPPAPTAGAVAPPGGPTTAARGTAGQLRVGPGERFARVADAVAASRAGQTILIRAGTYQDDYATITHALTLTAVGGPVVLTARGPIPNGKAILVTDGDVVVDGLTFAGASVPDGNGAGIRQQTGSLTVRNSRFEDNQDGILTAADPTSRVLIEDSTFVRSGASDGYTHAIYAGRIAELTVRRTTIAGTRVGHGVKSRAARTLVSGCTIDDGVNGSTTSYAVDLPDGGEAVVESTTIRQGVATENPTMISYGAEGDLHPVNSLTVRGNTLVDARSAGSTAVANHTSVRVQVSGNTLQGFDSRDTVLSGPGRVS